MVAAVVVVVAVAAAVAAAAAVVVAAAVRQPCLLDHSANYCDRVLVFVSAARLPFPAYVAGWVTHFRVSALPRMWALLEGCSGGLRVAMRDPSTVTREFIGEWPGGDQPKRSTYDLDNHWTRVFLAPFRID